MPLSWTTAIGIIKLPNAAVHDSGNWTCNNSEIEKGGGGGGGGWGGRRRGQIKDSKVAV